jgi:nucleotide-binding universal stress UspA family protein
MFNRILVAVDGSESSLNALRQTFPLARAEGSTIKVAAVVPPHEGELRLVGVRQNVAEMMSEPYVNALKDAQELADAAGVRVETILEHGEPHETIVELAEAERCDLIVVGVRGCNPADQVLLGSMTARVIGYSHTDILVVPKDSHMGLDHILVSVDGSESSKGAVKSAIELHRSYGSAVTVLAVADIPPHIYGVDPSVAEALMGKARKHLDEAVGQALAAGVQVEPLLREGEPPQLIVQLARETKSNLIVMGSHGRTGLKRLLMGSVTERVVGHAGCPVLVARRL